jgi:hypothetical protein
MPPSGFERNLHRIEMKLAIIRRIAKKEGFTARDVEEVRAAFEDIRDRAEIERRRFREVLRSK